MARRSGRSTCRCRATTPSAPHRIPRRCGRCVPRAPSLVRCRPARSRARRARRNRGRPALAGSGHRGSRCRSRCARSMAGRRQESCIRGRHVDTPRRTLRKRLRDIPLRDDHLEMLVDSPPRHFERHLHHGLLLAGIRRGLAAGGAREDLEHAHQEGQRSRDHRRRTPRASRSPARAAPTGTSSTLCHPP